MSALSSIVSWNDFSGRCDMQQELLVSWCPGNDRFIHWNRVFAPYLHATNGYAKQSEPTPHCPAHHLTMSLFAIPTRCQSLVSPHIAGAATIRYRPVSLDTVILGDSRVTTTARVWSAINPTTRAGRAVPWSAHDKLNRLCMLRLNLGMNRTHSYANR